MKIAVTGKGGVGKTTLVASLAHAFVELGCLVMAVDADPDSNLAATIGYPHPETITPLVEMKDLIEERTGAKIGSLGALFKLNPKVDDLPEKLWKLHDGIKLMVMGTVKKGGSGCVCPESVLLRALIQHLLLVRNEVIILDMEAGIEHLGRGTARAVEILLIVVEPGKRSLETSYRIRELAEHLGLKKIGVVGNKVKNENEKSFLTENLRDFTIYGFLPYSEGIMEGYRRDIVPWKASPELYQEVKRIALELQKNWGG
jgi:CO dehydrogenase maturation factor